MACDLRDRRTGRERVCRAARLAGSRSRRRVRPDRAGRRDAGPPLSRGAVPAQRQRDGSGLDLRVQIQTDPRYADFVDRAEIRDVLGTPLPVASLRDVLQGKVWAAQDPSGAAASGRKTSRTSPGCWKLPDLRARVPQDAGSPGLNHDRASTLVSRGARHRGGHGDADRRRPSTAATLLRHGRRRRRRRHGPRSRRPAHAVPGRVAVRGARRRRAAADQLLRGRGRVWLRAAARRDVRPPSLQGRSRWPACCPRRRW